MLKLTGEGIRTVVIIVFYMFKDLCRKMKAQNKKDPLLTFRDENNNI